jgi:ATP/maltotriose-dependent transcriptional regulator MalT
MDRHGVRIALHGELVAILSFCGGPVEKPVFKDDSSSAAPTAMVIDHSETAVAEFLNSAAVGPSGLVLEGEAGIGKTTLWLTAVEQARERGFRVLSAQPAAAESVQAYASLADLLSGVAPAVWADLPGPQRLAIDRVLLGTDSAAPATDQRAVAAAFLSIINRLTDDSPMLLAIDDLQWVDPSTVRVVEFAVRRLTGPIGILGAERTVPASETTLSWLRLPRPDAMRRIQVPPLSLGALHTVFSERLGRTFPRPTIIRIQEISGGNPLYAIEIARALTADAALTEAALPGTLAGLVQARIGGLASEVQEVLLAAACAAAPTVEFVARATGADTNHVVALLEDAEDNGIVEIRGDTICFVHPLLAQGIYTSVSAAGRRRMHRRLAEIVTEPELQARHLALAATSGDLQTLRSLDNAAEIARSRGAPAAAAELVNLARSLGGDTSERRISAARHLLAAGDSPGAVSIVEQAIADMQPGPLRAEAWTLLASGHVYHDGNVEAVKCFEHALAEVGGNLALRVQTLTALAAMLANGARFDDARRAIDDAVSHATRLGHPSLLGRACSARVELRMLQGEGYDDAAMQHALQQDDRDGDTPAFLRSRFHSGLTLSWAGQFDQARADLAVVRRRCAERGEENELACISLWAVQLEIWRGDFPAAAALAEDSYDRGLLVGGDEMFGLSRINKCVVAAYAGRVDEARRFGAEGIAACQRYGGLAVAAWGVMCIGFLEVSLGDHEAALVALAPLIRTQDAAPEATEIYLAWFVPDAVESLIQLGRLDEAELLIERLERNGRRLDRPWMLAMSARGRAMLLASRSDLAGANAAAQQAIAEHSRLAMPFERARTQLLVGQLQRRSRQKDAARATLQEALLAFEGMGTPLWAERARVELERVDVGPRQAAGLTPSEQRVAELAASGMTNRDVAAALFISSKTVEANLSRIYHKLGIRSRAELGRRLDHPRGGEA